MKRGELLKGKREEILQIAARYGAREVRVFGSVVRGEADEQSDGDFLVEMEPVPRHIPAWKPARERWRRELEATS